MIVRSRQSSWLVLLALAAILGLVPGQARGLEEYRFTETKSFEVGTSPEIELETVNGDVRYTAAPGTQATVTVVTVVEAADETEAAEIRRMVPVVLDGKAGLLTAKADHPDDFWRALRRRFGRERSISITFEVTGPAGAEGFLSSVSGNAEVSGADGPFDVQSVSGDVAVENVKERIDAGSVSGNCDVIECGDRVRANSVSGNVTVRGCASDARMETVSGDIVAADIAGGAEVTTVSGEVELTDIDGDLSVSSTSGNVEAEHKAGGIRIETVSGDIWLNTESDQGMLKAKSVSGNVRLATNPAHLGHLDLSTFSGDIEVASDLKGKLPMRALRANGSISVTVGDGGLDLQIDTQSGDIVLGVL